MKYTFGNILLIQTAFIGDVILSTAVIDKLKQYYPHARLDVLVKKENKDLLQGQPGIDHVLSFDKTKKCRELFRLLQEIRKNKYDLVVNLHRFASSGLLTAFSGGRIKVGFKKNPLSFLFTQRVEHHIGDIGMSMHEIERNQMLIRVFTDEDPARPRLHFSGRDQHMVAQWTKKPYVCIAPASVWFTKQFPEDRWIELIDRLPVSHTIFLLGGAGDVPLAERIRGGARRKGIDVLAGKISLLQSALLMKGAVLNYVNDSAPLHLASAVNAPVGAVFCSTIPAFGFGPLSDFSRIVEIDYVLECRPCNLHGYRRCPLGHFKCAKDISIEKMHHVFLDALVQEGA
jgi:heptosyltransferase-2